MTTGGVTAGTVLWEPPADIRDTSRIGRFLAWLESERGLSFAGYPELWEWSVTDLTGFFGFLGLATLWFGLR